MGQNIWKKSQLDKATCDLHALQTLQWIYGSLLAPKHAFFKLKKAKPKDQHPHIYLTLTPGDKQTSTTCKRGSAKPSVPPADYQSTTAFNRSSLWTFEHLFNFSDPLLVLVCTETALGVMFGFSFGFTSEHICLQYFSSSIEWQRVGQLGFSQQAQID